jgi:SAM-dependent methyltransferase
LATASVERWRTFWAEKTKPYYPQDTLECYAAHAQELKLLFGTRLPSRVLEIGCGNGALYPFLKFPENGAAYRGVDLSKSMLAVFKQKFPDVEVHCGDGSEYIDTRSRFDLIFSNQVVQFFDRQMLARHIANASAMLNPGGRLVCAAIPWRALRRQYDAGAFWGDMSGSKLRWLKSYFGRVLKRGRIGYWHEPHEILKLAQKHGLAAQFYGSFYFLYRFHAVLELK